MSATGRAFLQRASEDPQQQNGLDLPLGPAGAVIGVPAFHGDGWLVTVHLPEAAGEVTLCEVDAPTDDPRTRPRLQVGATTSSFGKDVR